MGKIVRIAKYQLCDGEGGKVIIFSLWTIVWTIFTSVLIGAAYLMIFIFTLMTVFIIYYSFVKRAGLLFCMGRKLKKAALQKLGRYEKHSRVQNSIFEAKFSPVAFKESLTLSRREYKIIFCVVLIMLIPLVCSAIFGAFYPRSAIFLAGLADKAPVFSKVIAFVFQGWLLSWACIVFFLPVVLILHALLHCGVKRTVKKLEKFA
ncbi:hypothetical protein [Bartonella sp. ML70XJBT.G]|uniref:hypothetical protein n=1 Tax=Bartonella sp. ML70XJBT.G TaxID=3019093 RepID=UPI002362D8DD|nr:hypothetical protein [Bartonella sp. ML70XJBT.G]